MVVLMFKPTSVRMTTGAGQSAPAFVSFEVVLTERRSVMTASGVDLSKLSWSVQLYANDVYNDFAKENGGFGVMSAWVDQGACHLSASVGQESFDRIVAALQVGRMPTFISADVSGLKFGPDFEGRDAVWDLESTPNAVVTELRVTFPFGSMITDQDGDPTKELAASPATAADIESLRNSMQRDIQTMTKTLYGPLWITAAVAVIVGIKLLFFR